MDSAQPESLAYVLVELSRQAERLATVDSREAEHSQHSIDRLNDLAAGLTAVREAVDDQRTALEAIDNLQAELAAVAAKLAEIVPDEDGEAKVYRPAPAPRWWKLEVEAHEEALTKLRAWVKQIYRPMYGHLAALGPCWESHPFCLMTLDWLSELWSLLYLQNRRTASSLAGQAEFQTRLLPAAVEQLATETARCEHAQPRNGQRAVTAR